MSSVAMLIPFLVIYVPLLGASIYAFILFIKLASRGIKALDIYPIASIRNTPTKDETPLPKVRGVSDSH